MTLAELLVKDIRRDGGTQMRAALDWDWVGELAEHADELPPAIVYYDGSAHWLADGFHRVEAWIKAGRKTAYAEVRTGSLRDAKRFALGCNGRHGRRPTPEDLAHQFAEIAADPEWGQLPNTEIAAMCHVSERTVRRYLVRASSAVPKMRVVERDGKSYPMDVSKLTRERFDALPEARKLEILRETEEKANAARAAELAAAAASPAKVRPIGVAVTLTLAPELAAEIDRRARANGLNREGQIVRVLEAAFRAAAG